MKRQRIGTANNRFMYIVAKTLSFWFYKLFFSLRVYGMENFPASGPYIVAVNHQSNIDPNLIGSICPPYIYSMAKKELFATPFSNWLFRALNAYPVERGTADMRAVKTGLELLARGNSLQLYPEGTRSRDGNPGRANPGVGLFVARAGAPVVPCYVHGTFYALPPGAKRLRRTPIRVFFGRPMTFSGPGFEGLSTKELYARIGDAIMDAICGLRQAGFAEGKIAALPSGDGPGARRG